MQVYETLRQTSEPISDEIEVPVEARNAFYLAMGKYIEDDVHGLWCDPAENMEGHQPDKLAVTIGQRFSELGTMFNGNMMQSPIEYMLAGALLWLDVDWAGMPKADFTSGPDDWREVGQIPCDGLTFVLTPQAKVANYKVDFLLWFCNGRHLQGIAVECDGHAFHEKTKEQAARDKKRDRAILAAGFPVMRFSGSEIYKDVLGCAEQVLDALSDPLYRVSKDSGLF